MLNSAEHEICLANKYQITNNCKSVLLNIAEHEKLSANKYENANLLAFSYYLVEKFSCSAELSMKKVYSLGTWYNLSMSHVLRRLLVFLLTL